MHKTPKSPLAIAGALCAAMALAVVPGAAAAQTLSDADLKERAANVPADHPLRNCVDLMLQSAAPNTICATNLIDETKNVFGVRPVQYSYNPKGADMVLIHNNMYVDDISYISRDGKTVGRAVDCDKRSTSGKVSMGLIANALDVSDGGGSFDQYIESNNEQFNNLSGAHIVGQYLQHTEANHGGRGWTQANGVNALCTRIMPAP